MRLTDTKRRAIVALFLHGFSFAEIGRLFKLPVLAVDNVVRDHARATRRRR